MSKKICIFGDSIAQGYYDLEEGGWANRLWIYLMEKANVYNLGINGDTSTGLIERMEQESVARSADTIIVSIGTNDSLIENGNSWVDAETFGKNLEKIVNISRKLDLKIIFTGVFKVDEKLAAPLSWDENLYSYNRELKKYDSIIENFCLEKNIAFVPLWEFLEKQDLFDGVHPNAEGHEKIFQRVKTCLEEYKII